MKIYIASSWKNAETVRGLAELLRLNGHDVFDFTNPEKRADGLDTFDFAAEDWSGEPLNKIDWLDFMEYQPTKRAYKSDKAGLHWADVVILLLPSGRSSHIEAGFAIGLGKKVYLWGDLPPGEFDTMYLLADGCYRSKQLPKLLKEIGK